MIYDYITIDKNKAAPLYLQLYESIKRAVGTGRIKKGDRLPSIRKLAHGLGVSCTTVDAAYQQLCVRVYMPETEKGIFCPRGAVSVRGLPGKTAGSRLVPDEPRIYKV